MLAINVSRLLFTATKWENLDATPSEPPPSANSSFKLGLVCFRATNSVNPLKSYIIL